MNVGRVRRRKEKKMEGMVGAVEVVGCVCGVDEGGGEGWDG